MNKSLRFTLLVFSCLYLPSALAQTGTYQKKDKNGSSCTIAIVRKGKQVKASVFAWWNTASGRHGVFEETGTLLHNNVVLTGADDCKVRLDFKPGKLSATFTDCMQENLPEDFSGSYQKITDAIPGNYAVSAEKAYFYKDANPATRKKSYLVKNDKVEVYLGNISAGGWVFVNFKAPSGQITSGYIQLSALQFIKS